MKNQVTPWFAEHIKPVYIGFYERDYGLDTEEVADYWDGNRWWIVPVYDLNKRIPSGCLFPWRGLAKKP